jgi:hypothetical protein
MVRFRRLAATAALTLVTHMASEQWPAAREAVADFWRPYEPGYGHRIAADLDDANAAVAAARAHGNRREERAVAAEWQGRIQALLERAPAAAPHLNRVLRQLPGGRVVSRRPLAARLVVPVIVLAIFATLVLLGYVHVSIGRSAAAGRPGAAGGHAPSLPIHHAPPTSAMPASSPPATAVPGGGALAERLAGRPTVKYQNATLTITSVKAGGGQVVVTVTADNSASDQSLVISDCCSLLEQPGGSLRQREPYDSGDFPHNFMQQIPALTRATGTIIFTGGGLDVTTTTLVVTITLQNKYPPETSLNFNVQLTTPR